MVATRDTDVGVGVCCTNPGPQPKFILMAPTAAVDREFVPTCESMASAEKAMVLRCDGIIVAPFDIGSSFR